MPGVGPLLPGVTAGHGTSSSGHLQPCSDRLAGAGGRPRRGGTCGAPTCGKAQPQKGQGFLRKISLGFIASPSPQGRSRNILAGPGPSLCQFLSQFAGDKMRTVPFLQLIPISSSFPLRAQQQLQDHK